MWSHEESLVYVTIPQQMRKSFIQWLCVALKSGFFISKKHLKPRNKRNRDNLFNVINCILANQVTIMKKTLYYKAGFPKLRAGIKVCREIFVFLTESMVDIG